MPLFDAKPIVFVFTLQTKISLIRGRIFLLLNKRIAQPFITFYWKNTYYSSLSGLFEKFSA